MEIRELRKTDVESLIELYKQLDDSNKGFTTPEAEQVWEIIEKYNNIHYFGAIDDGKVVSTCYVVIIPNLTHKGKSICFLENVVTDVNYRKQGLARKVIETAIQLAKKEGCYKVMLQSAVTRTEAHQFYENMGFRSDKKKAFIMSI